MTALQRAPELLQPAHPRTRQLLLTGCSGTPAAVGAAATCAKPLSAVAPAAWSLTRDAFCFSTRQARAHALRASCSSAGLVFGLGAPDSFDASSVGAPAVRCFVGDNEERWLLFYHGRATPAPGLHGPSDGVLGTVAVASSADGVTWARSTQPCGDDEAVPDSGAVLTPSSDWWTFDTAGVGMADVQVISNGSVDSGVGVFWMFYSGVDTTKHPPAPPHQGPDAPGRRPRIGLALSQTGRHWARIEGEHHSGAVLDVGPPGVWDEGGGYHPRVVLAGPRDLRLFYASPDMATGRFHIGMARSSDGLKWARRGVVLSPGSGDGDGFDAGGVTSPSVHRTGPASWVMFFEAHHGTSGARSIGVATSTDGLSWTKSPTGQPILGPSPGGWDAGGCGAPCGVQMAGTQWRLYYEGYAEGSTVPGGIGLALSGSGADAFMQPFKRRGGAV